MRVLLVSDLAHTGFGRVGRELGTGLLDRGWDVRIIGINWRGVDGEITSAIGRGTFGEQATRIETRLAELRADPLIERIMPAGAYGDGMGHNLTGPAIRGTLWPGWKPEAVVVVADPHAMWQRLATDNGAIGEARAAGVPTYNYVPVEGTGLPAMWRDIYRWVTPVAMSEFGQAQLAALLDEPVALVPHGVSTTFHPISAARPGRWRGKLVTSAVGAKEAIGFGGRTIILRTDRYVFRKNYPAWFRVLRPVLADHPDLIAIAHTTPIDDDGRGSIWGLISREQGATMIGVDNVTGHPVWDHPQLHLTGHHDSFRGIIDDELNVLYNAADLMVSTTMAEGFGLCLAESLACGVPVVATNYSAVPEVVGPGGILAPVSGLITNAYAHEWALVDEAAMTAAVERLISKPALRRELGTAGRRHVARFTWAAAVDGFDALLRARAAVAA